MDLNNTIFFSNTNPDLISSKTFSDLNKMVIIDDEPVKETKTLINTSITFYKKYIQPNLIPILIIILFISFMIYRYMTYKKDDVKKKKKKKLKNQNIIIDQENIINPPIISEQIVTTQTIDNVIDSVIKQNDDILDDEDIYEIMEEKSTDIENNDDDDNQHQDNNYINFAANVNRGSLNDANKKIFS